MDSRVPFSPNHSVVAVEGLFAVTGKQRRLTTTLQSLAGSGCRGLWSRRVPGTARKNETAQLGRGGIRVGDSRDSSGTAGWIFWELRQRGRWQVDLGWQIPRLILDAVMAWSSLWGCRWDTFVLSGLWDVSALLLSSTSSCHINIPDVSLSQGALQLQAVALAVTSRTMVKVTSRTMVKFGYISCSCTMLECALLLVTSDVDVRAGKISVLAGVPRV